MAEDMTPKEKAEELHDKFYQIAPHEFGSGRAVGHGRECALIFVEEMIKEHTWKLPMAWNIKREAFWQAVKKEIEKI